MDTTRLIDSLQLDLARAAEIGGPEMKAAAERLLSALEPALRLTLMDALSEAAAEIGAALPGVAIEVRLRGREPEFVVANAPSAPGAAETDFAANDGESVARITLRIPEALKAKAEALASRRGQSLNAWLVGAAARAATQDDDPNSFSHGHGRHGRGRMKGWLK